MLACSHVRMLACSHVCMLGRAVDFAGSDSMLKRTEYMQGGDLQMLPVVAGALVMVYNRNMRHATCDMRYAKCNMQHAGL